MSGEDEREMELDFKVTHDADGNPTLSVCRDGEESLAFVVDEISIDEDRENIIQSEEDAELLEQIEAKLA